MGQGKKGRKIWLAAAFLLLAAAMFFGGYWLRGYLVGKQAQDQREDLSEEVNGMEGTPPEEVSDNTAGSETAPEEDVEDEKPWEQYTIEEKYQAYFDTYGITVPEKNLDFEQLRTEVNEDIYAWLYVPGTDVDDPVVQHPTDDSHYLNYNLNGTMGYPGGIYTEGSCNGQDFTDRMTVIYGHNMRDGSGFGSLHRFEDRAVFEESRYIFIYLPDDIKVYEIFAAYEGSNAHIIYGHAWDDESWVEYLSDTLRLTGDKDNAVESYEFTADDRVLTLSTCIRNAPNQRYLVQGVLLDEAR